MTAVRLAGLMLVLALAAVALPGEAKALDPPVASCNGGGCGGWFKTGVTVTWSFNPTGVTGTTGCAAGGVSEDTAGVTFTCTVNYGGSFVGSSVTVRKDSSPPGVNVSPARDPDSNGWYTKPVDVGVSGDDGASGVASCTGGGTYGGPDSGGATVTGTCSDNAGNSASRTIRIKYDGSPPTVTGGPTRPPDANGWYNKPVDVTFTGSDAGSGVAECTPKALYQGPDAVPARLVGQCRDTAGHVSAPITVEFRYDATPPAPPAVKWVHRGSSIWVSWTAGKDVVRASVVRAPGLKGKKPAPVYDGKKRGFVDRKIGAGARYWYEVRLFDEAGNLAAKTVGLKPPLGIYAPKDGAIVTRAPLVQWAAVSKARFYNLQLWRGKVKLLTTWVRAPKLKLKETWRLGGTRHALKNGRYQIYIWPAFGTKKIPKYGKMLGQVTFVARGV